MADYSKTYVSHNWKNGTNPALSASNLNQIDAFIEELDDRTKELKATKEDRSIARSGGTSDYRQLTNKPVINGVELNGSLTLQALGIASASDLSALAEIVGDANALLEEV